MDTFLALVEAGVVLVVVRRVERRMVIWWSKMGQGGMTGKQGKGWFLNEISHFFLPLSRYIQSMYLIDHPNTTMKFKHVALKISGEGLDVSLLSSYKKYKSTNKNSQF
mgnify:CR=1 FL=1